MRIVRHHPAPVAILLGALWLLPGALAGQGGRPPTLDDLLAIEELGAITMSPDAREVAIVVRRARTAGEWYQRDRLGHHTRADVWLASPKGDPARNLTRGIGDHSGFWNPVWSPDGRYLAMLSTRGGDNVRAWVWDREEDRLKPVSRQGVETRSSVRLSEGWPHQPLGWIDSRTLLVHLLAEGEQPWDYSSWLGATETVRREWPLAARGTGVTSSVIESGVEGAGPPRGRGEVVLLDVPSGRVTPLAAGIFWHILPSPDRRRVALVQHVGWEHPQKGPLKSYLRRMRTRLAIVDLGEGNPRTTWIDGVPEPAIEVGSLRYAWSPDGAYLTVPDKEGRVSILEPSTGRHRILAGEVTSVAWTGAGTLLYRTSGEEGGWRAVEGAMALTGEPGRPLPPSTAGVSGWWTGSGGAAIAVADGDLVAWSLAAPGELRALAPPSGGEVTGIVWPDPATERGSPAADFVVTLASTDEPLYAHVRLSERGTEFREFHGPSSGAALRAFDAKTGRVAFRVVAKGSYAVQTGTAGPADGYAEVLRLNPHMDAVGVPERRLVRYRSLEGEELLGDLLLPYGYEAGRTYPLVVRVYGGQRNGGARDPEDGIASPFLNHHLLAANGYAVLEPSMPLGEDPMPSMLNGVAPAVDRVVELGIADPDRVAVLGQSFGGYSVYSLITQTDRFAAAIGLAGMTNLSSFYGSNYFSMRYNEWGYQWMEFANWLEYGQIGLGMPPWEDPERYVRNSPTFAADEVETPLLILHGDLDHVSIGQADELFSALYRQGKRARYVRYWGEAHVIQSPANLHDMWRQILSWLDEHLGDASSSARGSGGAGP